MALDAQPTVRLQACSPFFRSAAVGPGEQPDYCNAVALLRTDLDAPALLQLLLRIEQQLGRVRDGRRWHPRRLDLDLLCYAQDERNQVGLELPHPEIARRNFVLAPWTCLAPEFAVPRLGTVGAQACSGNDLWRAGGAGWRDSASACVS